MKIKPKLAIPLAGAAIISVAVASAMFMRSDDSGASAELTVPRNIDLRPGEGQQNPVFRQNQAEADARRADVAQRVGGTSLASPAPVKVDVSTPATAVVPTPAVEAPTPAATQQSARFDPMANTGPAPMPVNTEIRNQMKAFLSSEMNQRPANQGPTMRSYAADTKPEAAPAANTNGVSTVATNAAAQQKCVARQAGKIDYAYTINAIKSTQPGPVVAEIVAGPFEKGRLIGAFETQDEALFLRFTQLAMPNETVSIEAVAVSPETSETAVASYVDRHIFSRFVLPIAANFISGLGQAIARAGTITSQSTGILGTTTTSQSTRDLNTREVLFSAAGTAGQNAAQIFTENAPRGPTVGILPGTAVGIMWLRAVPGPC